MCLSLLSSVFDRTILFGLHHRMRRAKPEHSWRKGIVMCTKCGVILFCGDYFTGMSTEIDILCSSASRRRSHNPSNIVHPRPVYGRWPAWNLCTLILWSYVSYVISRSFRLPWEGNTGMFSYSLVFLFVWHSDSFFFSSSPLVFLKWCLYVLCVLQFVGKFVTITDWPTDSIEQNP